MFELIKQNENDVWEATERTREDEKYLVPSKKMRWVPQVVVGGGLIPDPDRSAVLTDKVVTEDAVTITHSLVVFAVDQVAAAKLGEISQRLDEELDLVAGGSSEIQQRTWGLFSGQANLNGRKPTASTVALKARADKRGVNVSVVRDEILAESALMEAGLGDATGESDMLKQAVAAAENHPTMTDEQKIDAILAVEWP